MRIVPGVLSFAIALPLTGCLDDEPELGVIEAGLLGAALDGAGPAPGLFEQLDVRVDGDPEAQLNFELRLRNTGTETAIVNRATLSYSGGTTISPVVARTDLRNFYLQKCPRAGFGLDRTGSLAIDLSDYNIEKISDVDTSSANVYLTVDGRRSGNYGSWGVQNPTKFVAAKLIDGHTLEWTREFSFLGFEDRANALTLAGGDKTYVAVGGAHPVSGDIGGGDAFNTPWSFAAVQYDETGNVVMRADGVTQWKRVLPFTGCSAEAVDVARVSLTAQTYAYFLAGTAKCAGDSRVAVALLDADGVPIPAFGGTGSFVINPPGAAFAKVGGVVVDPVTNNLYVIGALGDDLMVLGRTLTGAAVPGFGVGGMALLNPASHDHMMGWDAKVMADSRLAIAVEGRKSATGVFQLGLARLTPTGAPDPSLNVTSPGFVAVSVPTQTNAWGHDLEIHENETWFTVSGHADVGAGTANKVRMVAAAFAPNGTMRTGFDGDGFLVLPPASKAPATRSAINGDYITVVGATGSILGGARFHRKDGTPDDPTVLGAGESCALYWPDTGIRPAGATHLSNTWDLDALPTQATAQVRLLPYAGGTSTTTAVWTGPLQRYIDSGWKFPGEAPTDEDTYWMISGAHEVTEPHRSAVGYSSVQGRYMGWERSAYDIAMQRWDGAKWVGTVPGTDGDQNNESLVYGEPVHPIGHGQIVYCTGGVQENKAPGFTDIKTKCNANGIPCFFDYGGNSFRVLHDDGSLSYYAHLQPNPGGLCPYTNGGGPVMPPIEVFTTDVLGRVGNSGNSGGPHLHLQHEANWDPPTQIGAMSDWDDNRPLMFDNVKGIPNTIAPDDFPELHGPFPVAAQRRGTLLRMYGPNDPPPPPETTCETVDVNAAWPPDREADGDAGPTLYCPDEDTDDDGYIDTIKTCVLNGDGSSDCQICGQELGEMYPGCPCDDDDQCGTGMTCWGDEYGPEATLVDLPGLCYPLDALPVWSCGYDCRANLDDQAWCNNDFASLTGRARCMDQNTDTTELEMCWEYGYIIESACPDPDEGIVQSCVETCVCDHGGNWDTWLAHCESDCQPSAMPARDGECSIECTSDADCHTTWNYPSEYHCDNGTGVPVCRIPL